MRQLSTLGLLLITHLLMAQVPKARLDSDPVFTTLLSRRIHYPAEAEKNGIYAKLYVGFRIDEKGHVQDILMLNPDRIGYGFETEVTKAVSLLPPLKQTYAGLYALPVTFALFDALNSGQELTPSGTLPSYYLSGRVVLTELKRVSGRTPIPKGKLSAQSVGYVVTTDR